jgi:ATP-binding cassette subfamily B protein
MFIGLLFAMLFLSTIPALDGYLAKIFINKVNSDFTSRDYIFFPFIFFLWWESINIVWRLADYCLLKTLPNLKITITKVTVNYCFGHSYKYFQENFSGSIANKISDLAKGIESLIKIFFLEFIRKSFIIIFSVMTLYFVHPIFAILLAFWCGIFIILSQIFARRIEALSNNFAENRSLSFGKMLDSIANISNIRIFARRKYEIEYLGGYYQQTKQKDQNLKWYELKTNYIKGFFNSISISLMILGLVYFKGQNIITIGDFALILTICLAVLNDIWDFSRELSEFSEQVGVCNQSLKLVNTEYGIKDAPDAKPLKLSRGEVIFDKVNFSYQGRHNLFGNKSVLISPGQKVGLVGYSGSGKSTFVNLIIRLFDVTSGRILIDGQDITKITQDSLREAIGFIPQDPILFHRSLKDNIRYGKPEASNEEVYAASKSAHAHDFIIKTPDGYDTLVGERGIKLSGGQRQRIAIARAILKNAPILILDEATSSLDSITEKHIQDSLYQLMEGKTTIVVAHRLSTLLQMDRIMVFNRGEIIQDGKHSDLINQKGLYKTLWDAQVQGFLPARKKYYN